MRRADMRWRGRRAAAAAVAVSWSRRRGALCAGYACGNGRGFGRRGDDQVIFISPLPPLLYPCHPALSLPAAFGTTSHSKGSSLPVSVYSLPEALCLVLPP